MPNSGQPAPAVTDAPPRLYQLNPYVHFDASGAYNPLTDARLGSDDPRVAQLRSSDGGVAAEETSELVRGGWLIEAGTDLSRQHRLKFVSLETNTVCNQACYFCPVSVDPREADAMSDELFDSIIEQLAHFRGTLEGVFLQSYNEPTIDKRFVEHCKRLFTAKIPVAVLTNGSALTPAKVDALAEHGPLRYIAVNLSTLDRERYAADRGGDHLQNVLKYLDYAKDKPFAEQMKIVVLGKGDEVHASDHAMITERFAGSRFEVEPFRVMDRAGYLDIGLKAMDREKKLAGCDNVGSRPIQHLHIVPSGECVLCCQDYDEKYVVGDLTKQSILEVLEGDELAKLRRWSYGVEESPDDFMCRDCVFALRR